MKNISGNNNAMNLHFFLLVNIIKNIIAKYRTNPNPEFCSKIVSVNIENRRILR